MAKISLSTILSGFLSNDTLTDNFDKIEAEFQDKVLYRNNPSGEPNQMEDNLDMNSKRILNLPSPVSNSEPARWSDVKDGVTGISETIPSKTGNEYKMLGTDGSGLYFYDTGIQVENKSTMSALTPSDLNEDQVVYMKGRSTVGDGGGGVFRVTKSDISTEVTADSGEVIYIPFDSDVTGANGGFIRIDKGPINVLWAGATGDGTTDDTVAVQNAIKSSYSRGGVMFPTGVYRITSTLTITRGVSLFSESSPGNGTGDADTDTHMVELLHDFDGDFIVFDGSDTTVQGAGGGLSNIQLIQGYGSSGTSAGKAIVLKGTSTNLRATWVRIQNVNFERTSSSVADWEWCIDIDGSGVGGVDGVRDIWVDSCRTLSDSSATGAIRVYNAFNVFITNSELNLSKGILSITGPDNSNKSSGVYVSNIVGEVQIDYASGIEISGGRLSSISSTTNTSESHAYPTYLTNIPASLPGMSLMFGNSQTTWVMSNNATVFHAGQDINAGDTTDTKEIKVGNTGQGQGSISVQYTNAAATDSPAAKIQFFPRNNADSGAISGTSISFTKTSGADTTRTEIENSEGSIILHEDGYAIIDMPFRLKAYTVAGVPSAAANTSGIIYVSNETGGATLAFSDGTNWRRVQDRSIIS